VSDSTINADTPVVLDGYQSTGTAFKVRTVSSDTTNAGINLNLVGGTNLVNDSLIGLHGPAILVLGLVTNLYASDIWAGTQHIGGSPPAPPPCYGDGTHAQPTQPQPAAILVGDDGGTGFGGQLQTSNIEMHVENYCQFVYFGNNSSIGDNQGNTGPGGSTGDGIYYSKLSGDVIAPGWQPWIGDAAKPHTLFFGNQVQIRGYSSSANQLLMSYNNACSDCSIQGNIFWVPSSGIVPLAKYPGCGTVNGFCFWSSNPVSNNTYIYTP